MYKIFKPLNISNDLVSSIVLLDMLFFRVDIVFCFIVRY